MDNKNNENNKIEKEVKKNNDCNIESWLGPKKHYEGEKELDEFYVQMNKDCSDNDSRAILEWLRNAPCFDDFNLDGFKMWKEDGKPVCFCKTNQSLARRSSY